MHVCGGDCDYRRVSYAYLFSGSTRDMALGSLILMFVVLYALFTSAYTIGYASGVWHSGSDDSRIVSGVYLLDGIEHSDGLD